MEFVLRHVVLLALSGLATFVLVRGDSGFGLIFLALLFFYLRWMDRAEKDDQNAKRKGSQP